MKFSQDFHFLKDHKKLCVDELILVSTRGRFRRTRVADLFLMIALGWFFLAYKEKNGE